MDHLELHRIASNGDKILHLAQEVIRAMLSMCIATAAVVAAQRSAGRKDFYWFGITGLFLAVMFATHAILSMSTSTGDARTFIPLTWLAASIVDPVLLSMARKHVSIWKGALVAGLVIPAVFLGLFQSDVTAYYHILIPFLPEIGRPQEFAAIIPITIVLIWIAIDNKFNPFKWRYSARNMNKIDKVIASSLILSNITCITMIFSLALFDAWFVIAHTIGIFALIPMLRFQLLTDPKNYKAEQNMILNKFS